MEFEILFSCYTLDLPERLSSLEAAGFTASERDCLADRLRTLTNRVINTKNGLWLEDIRKIGLLEERFQAIRQDCKDPVARIYWLLEDCKRYGTLPFAGLARAGFIAIQLLRSLVSTGVLTERDYQAFLGSLSTVSSEIGRDFAALDRQSFLNHYGHLRPGTYDIRSLRYDSAPDLYFDWSGSGASTCAEPHPFALTLPQMNDTTRLLATHELDHDVVGLFNFLKAGIEGREAAKFAFSRNLSLALEDLADLGSRYGFDRDDMSYADIGALYRLYASCDEPQEILAGAIEAGRRRHDRTLALALPNLIVSPGNARIMEIAPTEPNFVTQRVVLGDVRDADPEANLEGAIVAKYRNSGQTCVCMTRPIAIVTQRVVIDPITHERRDALDQRWAGFLAACGLASVAAPNHAGVAIELWRLLQPAALVLTGGNDLACVGGDAPERDHTEQALLELALAERRAVIGVCRGMQMIGVYLGGDLAPVADHVGEHAIRMDGGVRMVNSFHNYALVRAPDTFTTAACSVDGTVECMRGREAPILGMMWHPERVCPFDSRDIDLVRAVLKAEPCAA